MTRMFRGFDTTSTDSELRGFISPADREALESDLDSWFGSLICIRERTDSSHNAKRLKLEEFRLACLDSPTGRRDYLHARLEFEQWKHRNNSFRRIVEERMRMVKMKMKERDGNLHTVAVTLEDIANIAEPHTMGSEGSDWQKVLELTDTALDHLDGRIGRVEIRQKEWAKA